MQNTGQTNFLYGAGFVLLELQKDILQGIAGADPGFPVGEGVGPPGGH